MGFNIAPLGILTVTVISAMELKNRDGLFGKNDTYTVLIVGKQREKTRVIFNAGSKAFWNQQFTFQVFGMEALEVTCYDYDMITSDDVIGRATIFLDKLFQVKALDDWFDITHKNKCCGKIHLRITLDLTRAVSPRPPSPEPTSVSPKLRAKTFSMKIPPPRPSILDSVSPQTTPIDHPSTLGRDGSISFPLPYIPGYGFVRREPQDPQVDPTSFYAPPEPNTSYRGFPPPTRPLPPRPEFPIPEVKRP
ncbi:hypothetical protein DSO57_1037584 [Entomophthora muscae]|uniref:Uncharacterized protein n=1 Tax=Entomophthora muscae TaxID=34485 RepID=A0ACC2TLD0_9FUNG|nr:hypothetical protein DSO57_1037584 [Entomophthora muscae]